jgi:RNA polymerase subunit RPABC4/transcription elongation factor Spt4
MEQVYTLCPKCGKMIKAGLKFCPHCGDRFVPEEKVDMVCPKCGKIAPEGEKFCSECGTLYAAKQAAPTPQETPVEDVRVQTNIVAPVSSADTSQEAFFKRYTKKSTQGWVRWLPIIGFISAAIYVILAIAMFATNTISGAFMLVDVVAVGGLSYLMYTRKQAWPFIAFAGYNVVASILAFISMDFSNLFWLVFSIYTAVKMWKVEKAYQAYLHTGSLPKELI